MNYQAVLFKSFNEGLHYYYMKGLVATRNYREALKYYDCLLYTSDAADEL